MIETIQSEPIKSRFTNSRSFAIKSLLRPLISFSESLDDTRTRHYRAREDDPGTFRASGNGVNFPTAILLYLIAQLIGGIWWAATTQATQNYLLTENAKLWQKVETHDLQLARQNDLIRAAVKEALQDYNIRQKREE